MLFRTLAIFERKSKWALLGENKDSWDGERWRNNNVSAAERPDVIRKEFEEEVKEGLMTRYQHLVVASLWRKTPWPTSGDWSATRPTASV